MSKNLSNKLLFSFIALFIFGAAFGQNPTVKDGVATYHSNKNIGKKYKVPDSWDKIIIKENVTLTGSFYMPTRNHPIEICGENRKTSIIQGDGSRPTDDGIKGRSYSSIRCDKSPDLYVHDLKITKPMKFHIHGGFGKVTVERCDIIAGSHTHTTDGIHGGLGKTVVKDCYIDCYDDALYTVECKLVENTTIVHNKNGGPFMTSWGASVPNNHICVVRNCTVIDNYDGTNYNHGVFSWAGKSDSKEQTIHIKFEGTFTHKVNPGKKASTMYTIGRPNDGGISNAIMKIDGICLRKNSIDTRYSKNSNVVFVNCDSPITKDCAGVEGGTAKEDCGICWGGTTGVSKPDADNDGIVDCNDACPNDATNSCNSETITDINDLKATVINCKSVELTWGDVAQETEYRIRRKIEGESTFTTLGDVNANVTEYTDNSVKENTTYIYQVRPVQNDKAVKISNTPIAKIPACTLPKDCAGVEGGSASIDDCEVCSGGTTGIEPNSTCVDCNGDVNGTAAIDDCGVCAGGETGIVAGEACKVEALPIPGKIEAEDFTAQQGVETQATTDAEGGENVGWIGAGDWMKYDVTVAEAGTYTVAFRVASLKNAIKLDLKSGTKVLTSINTPTTNGWQTWKTVTAEVALSAGAQELEILATGGGWNINWIEFTAVTLPEDCAGVAGGTAKMHCGICWGGTTGVEKPDADNDGIVDCNDECPNDATNSCNDPQDGNPQVTIISPVDGDSFDIGATITVELTASDSDGSIKSHIIYVNGAKVDTDGSSYTAHKITNAKAGTYVIEAEVTDNAGNTAKDEVIVFVEAPVVIDCDGVEGGSAFIDNCGECVGGTTSKTACQVGCIEEINFPGGRVALSFDGNQHDPDDIGALPISLAFWWAAGLQDKVVHIEHSNHVCSNSTSMNNKMKESAQGMIDRFGFDATIMYNYVGQQTAATNNLIAEINKSSANDHLWIIAAGPMESVWRALNGSDKSKHKYVTFISHSKWNQNHGDCGSNSHTWADMKKQFPDPFYVENGDNINNPNHLLDQNSSNGNNDFNTPNDKWYWLRDHSNSDYRWLYSRDQFSNKFDPSDAGMSYFLITGGPHQGGKKNAGWPEAKKLLNNACPLALKSASAATALEVVPEVEVTIFPNPVTSEATINADSTIESIVIYSQKGSATITETGISSTSVTLQLGSLVNGEYYIMVITENGSVTKSIIKK